MIRRLCLLVLGGFLLFSHCVPALAANTMQQGSMYVNTSNGKALRFRSSKSTSANNILAEIPYGTKVYVSSWDGTWARIRYNSAIGYVVRKHLSIARPDPFEEVQARQMAQDEARKKEKELKAANSRLDHSRIKTVAEPYDVTVRTGVEGLTAVMYEKPSLLSNIVGSYVEGDRLAVAAENKDWALIYDGSSDRSGYMLLEELEPDLVEEEILEDE